MTKFPSLHTPALHVHAPRSKHQAAAHALRQAQQGVQQLLRPESNNLRCRTPLAGVHGPLMGPGSLAWPQGVDQHPVRPMSLPSSSPNSPSPRPSPPNSPYSWFSNPLLYVTNHNAEEPARGGGRGTPSCDAEGQAPGGGSKSKGQGPECGPHLGGGGWGVRRQGGQGTRCGQAAVRQGAGRRG